ncbi:MAG: hypothetical protein HY608_03230 [Planctomycetes bacterium]|nr:hypothetical protein [Planctomycetota bacterium]
MAPSDGRRSAPGTLPVPGGRAWNLEVPLRDPPGPFRIDLRGAPLPRAPRTVLIADAGTEGAAAVLRRLLLDGCGIDPERIPADARLPDHLHPGWDTVLLLGDGERSARGLGAWIGRGGVTIRIADGSSSRTGGTRGAEPVVNLPLDEVVEASGDPESAAHPALSERLDASLWTLASIMSVGARKAATPGRKGVLVYTVDFEGGVTSGPGGGTRGDLKAQNAAPACARRLDDAGVRATFFVDFAGLHDDADRRAVAALAGRHELGVHNRPGWTHRDWADAIGDDAAIGSAISQAMAALEHLGGDPRLGMRYPGFRRAGSTHLLLAEHGIRCSANRIVPGDRPVWPYRLWRGGGDPRAARCRRDPGPRRDRCRQTTSAGG